MEPAAPLLAVPDDSNTTPEFPSAEVPELTVTGPDTPPAKLLAEEMTTEPLLPVGEPLLPELMRTEPPDWPTAVVAPADNANRPPVPLLPLPTTTLIAPPEPLVASPVPNTTTPELPASVVPELNVRLPDVPDEAALADTRLTDPEEELVDNPLVMETEPPTLEDPEDAPAARNTLPPFCVDIPEERNSNPAVPLVPAPTTTLTLPPRPLVAAPLTSAIQPEFPDTVVPVLNTMPPEAVDVDAVPAAV